MEARAATSRASFTAGTRFPTSGALTPAWDVEKKTGSMSSKSRSARMRCTSTDPTMPRQPIMPTFMGSSVNDYHLSARCACSTG